MTADGKRLESLVAFVEKIMLPLGFAVTTNDRVFNDEGVQIAEFDIQIRGRVGKSDFAWLIECRDRPSSGPAPGAWIEQLVGRRLRFNFNKVTAVSTTGFAIGATEFALLQGIELREVNALSVEAFSDWLQMRYITSRVRHTTLLSASFLLDESTPKALHDALGQALPAIDGNSKVLRSSSTGDLTTPSFAFSGMVGANEHLFEGLAPNGPPKSVTLHAEYPTDDHFVIDTKAGSVSVPVIVFVGELRLKESQLPVVFSGEYRNSTSGETISQVVSFAPQSILGMKFATEMHKFAATGQTRVVLRRVAGDANPRTHQQ